jgi:methylated-DNA-protein-cysteine methyltransferase related protein
MLSRVSRPRSRLASQALWLEPRSSADPFCAAAREVIVAIPRGKVATYGQVAHLAGKPWGARQVAWILHSQSEKYNLPWQRVIGADGRISLPPGRGLEEQRRLLRAEGVEVSRSGRIDLGKFRWLAEDDFSGK